MCPRELSKIERESELINLRLERKDNFVNVYKVVGLKGLFVKTRFNLFSRVKLIKIEPDIYREITTSEIPMYIESENGVLLKEITVR